MITSGDGSRGEPLIREFRTSTPRSRREKPNAMAIVSARLAPRTVLAWTCGRINRRLPSHPRYQRVSVPDALHVAVMACHDITELMGLDRGFDAYPGINGLT